MYGGEPRWTGVALGCAQEDETFTWRFERLDRGRLATLKRWRLRGGQPCVGPPFGAARHGGREFRTSQLVFEEPESLDSLSFLEVAPVNPVLLVQLAPLAGLPDGQRRELAVP